MIKWQEFFSLRYLSYLNKKLILFLKYLKRFENKIYVFFPKKVVLKKIKSAINFSEKNFFESISFI